MMQPDEPDLFGWTGYPDSPGFKEHGGTSELAAARMSLTAGTLRAKAYAIIAASDGMTADEVARTMNESVLAIRPRITELGKAGWIYKTDMRRCNVSGMPAVVWRARR